MAKGAEGRNIFMKKKNLEHAASRNTAVDDMEERRPKNVRDKIRVKQVREVSSAEYVKGLVEDVI